jgi:hypothetical protein
MANFYLDIKSDFKPYTFEEMLKPVALEDAYHKQLEEEYALLDSQLSSAMTPKDTKPLDPTRGLLSTLEGSPLDQDSYDIIDLYKDDLQEASNSLARDGLNPYSRGVFNNLRKRYSEEILPISAAYNNRIAKATALQDLVKKDPTFVAEYNPMNYSLSEYVNNPALDHGRGFSKKDLTDTVKTFAESFAKADTSALARYGVKIPGHTMTSYRKGFTPQEIEEARQIYYAGGNSKNPRIQALIEMVRNAVKTTTADEWQDGGRGKREAEEAAWQGAYASLGGRTYDHYANPWDKPRSGEDGEKKTPSNLAYPTNTTLSKATEEEMTPGKVFRNTYEKYIDQTSFDDYRRSTFIADNYTMPVSTEIEKTLFGTEGLYDDVTLQNMPVKTRKKNLEDEIKRTESIAKLDKDAIEHLKKGLNSWYRIPPYNKWDIEGAIKDYYEGKGNPLEDEDYENIAYYANNKLLDFKTQEGSKNRVKELKEGLVRLEELSNMNFNLDTYNSIIEGIEDITAHEDYADFFNSIDFKVTVDEKGNISYNGNTIGIPVTDYMSEERKAEVKAQQARLLLQEVNAMVSEVDRYKNYKESTWGFNANENLRKQVIPNIIKRSLDWGTGGSSNVTVFKDEAGNTLSKEDAIGYLTGLTKVKNTWVDNTGNEVSINLAAIDFNALDNISVEVNLEKGIVSFYPGADLTRKISMDLDTFVDNLDNEYYTNTYSKYVRSEKGSFLNRVWENGRLVPFTKYIENGEEKRVTPKNFAETIFSILDKDNSTKAKAETTTRSKRD